MEMILEKESHLLHATLTRTILQCCFDVMKEIGAGFLESVYKKSLAVALHQEGLIVAIEKTFNVLFRNHSVGTYIADLVVNDTAIVEVKCCERLLPEHLAQTINYLSAASLPIGILVNFKHKNLEYKRVSHPTIHPARSCERSGSC